MIRVFKIAFILALLSQATLCWGQAVDEYTLKAIWIGKFTHFIDWPAYNHDSLEEFTIATLNTNPFENKLETVYKNYEIWGAPVNIIHLKELNDSTNIQILFIPPLNERELEEVIKYSHDKGVLLIGETNGYAEAGIHLNFFLADQRIRFEINESAMRNSNFFVSYRLLNIAKIVEPLQ